MIQTVHHNQHLNLLNKTATVGNEKSKPGQAASFDSYLQAASAQTTTVAVSGTDDNYVISPEDKEKYCGILVFPDTGKTIYYPPDNAPGSVKKAWVETMKSLNDEERFQAKIPILFAMSNHNSRGYYIFEEAQSYLSQSVSSMSSLQELYRNSIEKGKEALGMGGLSKASIDAQKKQIELEKRVLDSLMKYGN